MKEYRSRMDPRSWEGRYELDPREVFAVTARCRDFLHQSSGPPFGAIDAIKPNMIVLILGMKLGSRPPSTFELLALLKSK